MDDATPKELRAEQVAHVLARGVRNDEVNPIDACRILKHELRRLNTNRSHALEVRSRGAQASIQKHVPKRPPPNGSDDSLHADHVCPFTANLLHEVTTLDAWVGELRRLAAVVCVTAKENYALERVEKAATAGVTFATPVPWQVSDL